VPVKITLVEENEKAALIRGNFRRLSIDNYSLTLKPSIIKAVLILLVNICCFCNISRTQAYLQLNSFTTNEGLPSNHIYKCVQDKRGFLWIASENGLSRFDGQRFKNFTVSDGLPDNEILDIFLDSTERLWIIPFTKTLAFIDTKTSKIVSSEIEAKNGLLGNTISNNRMAVYQNEKTVRIIENNKIVYSYETPNDRVAYVKSCENGEIIISTHAIVFVQNGKLINRNTSLFGLTELNVAINKVVERDGSLFIFRGDSVMMQIKNLDERLLPIIKTKKYSFRTWNISSLHNYIGATGRDGIIYLIDPESLEIVKTIEIGENVKDIAEDKEGNFWVSTDSKGLIKIGKPMISAIDLPLDYDKNITALNIDSTGILAGNSSSTLIELSGNYFRRHNLVPGKEKYNNITLKKILRYRNNYCILSFNGLHIGKNTFFKKVTFAKGFKDAVFINDTSLLLGAYNYLYRCNLNSGNIDTLVKKRITAVAVNENGDYYYGSNDGLYKLLNGIPEYFGAKNNILANNVTSLLSTSDNLIWVGTASDTLIALQNDSIILRLPIKSNFRGAVCKTLASKNNGQVWIGTERSLGRIDYTLHNGKITYTCIYFDKSDGLNYGQVNQIAFYKDSVYVATNNGINKLYFNAKSIINDIPVHITKMSINNKDVDIKESYELTPSQNNIQIEFTGIDLTGFNPQFQYKVNNSDWQDISDNTLTLSSLAHGSYTIQIRAIKRNNEPCSFAAILKIKIKTPLLLSPSFWAITVIVITGFFFWLFNRRRLIKQKRIFQQQLALEQQRNKITADLHDDIGSSLSSLQVNSAVANQLIDKDTKQAKQVLDKIETQSKDLADKIGDIIWSMKPGKDEFMTMSSRIRTFANDILGSTDIDYEVKVDAAADTDIKDITTRKNIVLITKEAINNAVKYSKATHVFIQLRKDLSAGAEPGRFVLNINDNGIGFISNGTNGNGIANMKRRATEMNGTLCINTAPGKGTSVFVVIPFS